MPGRAGERQEKEWGAPPPAKMGLVLIIAGGFGGDGFVPLNLPFYKWQVILRFVLVATLANNILQTPARAELTL